jgi:cupin 2 domain-containing protein
LNLGSLFGSIGDAGSEEFVETIVRSGGVRIERIVSRGHKSPDDFWYDQDENEWVVVLSGRARLVMEGEDAAIELAPGDWIDIPARKKHRVEWTDPNEETVWLAVFYPDPESQKLI